MADFVNGQRVEVEYLGEWVPAVVVGSDLEATICRRESAMWWESRGAVFEFYRGFSPDSIRPAKRTREEIAWEAVEDYFGDFGNAECELHALILAAIEEACDE